MTDNEMNEARELIAMIGLRKAARQLGMNHSTLYRLTHKQQQQESAAQSPMQQLVDALERFTRDRLNRPPMPATNPNWPGNCIWVEKYIEANLDSWKMCDD